MKTTHKGYTVTPRRALRLAHFTRALWSMWTDHVSYPYWMEMADEAERWANAKLAGRPTNILVRTPTPENLNSHHWELTDYCAGVLAQFHERNFGLVF